MDSFTNSFLIVEAFTKVTALFNEKAQWENLGFIYADSQHSFTKGKSCLTNLVALCDGVATTVDKERAMDVI